MKKRGLIIFFLILLVLPSVYSLGITPSKVYLDYKPGQTAKIDYTIMTNTLTEIGVDGFLSEYAKVQGHEPDSTSFSVIYDFPESVDIAGTQKTYVEVREKKDANQGFGTLLKVRALVIIDVPYPGLYAEMTVGSENVIEGQPVRFKITVYNKGKDFITNARANIQILHEDKIVKTLSTESVSLESATEKELFAVLDTSDMKPGKYQANIILTYSSSSGTKTLKEEKNFVIGTLFVDVIDWKKEFLKDEVNEIEVKVESIWNNPIENVFADIEITKGNAKIATLKTPSETLGPFKQATLKTYWDTNSLEVGEYDAKILVHYEGKTTEKNVKLNVIEKEKEKSEMSFKISTTTLLVGIVIIIIAINVILLVLLKKKKK